MDVAQTNQRAEVPDNQLFERDLQLVARVVVAVDVPPNAGAAEQLHVVTACEQTDVVDLWHAGREKLNRAREQIVAVDSRERVVEGAVDLVQIQVRCGSAGRKPARTVRRSVDGLDEPVKLVGGTSPGREDRPLRADVDDADTVMGVETVSALRGRCRATPREGRAVPNANACSTSGGKAKS